MGASSRSSIADVSEWESWPEDFIASDNCCFALARALLILETRSSSSETLITDASLEEADEEPPLEEVELVSFFLLLASSVLCFSRYSLESCRSLAVVFLSELSFAVLAAPRRFSAKAANAFVRAPSSVEILPLILATRALACSGLSLTVVFVGPFGAAGRLERSLPGGF